MGPFGLSILYLLILFKFGSMFCIKHKLQFDFLFSSFSVSATDGASGYMKENLKHSPKVIFNSLRARWHGKNRNSTFLLFFQRYIINSILTIYFLFAYLLLVDVMLVSSE